MQFAQMFDHAQVDPATAGQLNPAGLQGTWINSNPDTNGIARMVMSESNGKLSLQVFAIGPEGLIDWGKSEVSVFAATPSSRVGAGFTCLFDLGFVETRLQGSIVKGLLVLAQFHSFKDDSKRVDYFVREYFALISYGG
jgi:hypothetical protein